MYYLTEHGWNYIIYPFFACVTGEVSEFVS